MRSSENTLPSPERSWRQASRRKKRLKKTTQKPNFARRALRHTVTEAREAENSVDDDGNFADVPLITLDSAVDDEACSVEKANDYFIVHGAKIVKFARRTNFDQLESINRLRDIMKRLGVSHELRRQGAEGDSLIQVDDHEFTQAEQFED